MKTFLIFTLALGFSSLVLAQNPTPTMERLSYGTVLFTAIQNSQGSSELTVSNGTANGAVAKVIDPANGKKLLSFFVRPNDSTTIVGVPTGSYRLIFAFGDTVYAGTDRLTNPNGFAQFDNKISFFTVEDSTGTNFNHVTVTLQPVVGGTAKSSSISKAEFEKW